MHRKRSGLTAPEAHVAPANRYWEGAEELVLRIVLLSPDLYAANVKLTQRQCTPPWAGDCISPVKYAHQLRQIRRRKERKHESQ